MCTVIVEVPELVGAPVRLCAVRDENPDRAWDPLGEWWPQAYPGVRGVRDRVAGGAWLATRPEQRELAVILNRVEPSPAGVPAVSHPRASRGAVVLDAVSEQAPRTHPDTAPYNLVTVSGSRASVTSWDGTQTQTQTRVLPPGVHMIAHHEVDDPATARIAEWLPRFRALAGAPEQTWRAAWLDLLTETAALPATDDHAIIRDNRPHGYPTLSLLVCIAEVGAHAFSIAEHPLADPGRWQPSVAHSLLG